MARIRTIKPEFWSSPGTASCEDPWARLLFIAMWNWADDCGRGTANARELAGFAFPNDEWISNDDVRRMLGGIRRAFGVEFYKVAGRPYYTIPSWDRHQKIDKRSGAKYPGPEEGEEWDPDPTQPPDLHRRNGSRCSAESSADPAESTPSPRRNLDAGTGEQGNRGTGEQASSPPPAARDDVEQLCTRLRDRMIGNGFKAPAITDDWRRQARLLLDKDERDLTQALRLIDWATADEFWHPNIKSMGKFRAQYDTLLARARQEQQRRQANVRPAARTADDKIAALQALKTGGSNVYTLPRGVAQ